MLVAVTGLTAASRVEASLSYDLNLSVNGTAPTSPSPWFTAKFDPYSDATGSGVELALSSNLEVDGEFVTEVAFNLGHVANARITQYKSTLAVSKVDIKAGDEFSLGPIKSFNVDLSWATSNGKKKSDRFNQSDVVTFRIAGISMEDLGGTTLYKGMNLVMAAKVAGVPGTSGTSGEIAFAAPLTPSGDVVPVPEPGTIVAGLLLLFPLGASVLRARRLASTQTDK